MGCLGLIGGWGDPKLQLGGVRKLNGWVLELNFAGQIINFKSSHPPSLHVLLSLCLCIFLVDFMCIYALAVASALSAFVIYLVWLCFSKTIRVR